MSNQQSKLDQNIEAASKISAAEVSSLFRETLRPPYEKGQTVKVKITQIKEAGAQCITADTHQYPGWIHISGIANSHVEKIEDYIQTGEEYEAHVKEIRENRQNGFYRLEFSLNHLNLAPRIPHPSLSRLAELKDRLPHQAEAAADASPRSQSPGGEKRDENVLPMKDAERESRIYANLPKDERDLFTFIVNICGIVSRESEERVYDLLKKHGKFQLTVAMWEARKSFVPDLSAHFLNEVEKRIGDGL